MPSYEQKSFGGAADEGRLRLIGSHSGRDGSLTIHQDVDLYAARLSRGDAVSHAIGERRLAWVQVARGEVNLNGEKLMAGDGVATTEPGTLKLEAASDAEVLLFDMGK